MVPSWDTRWGREGGRGEGEGEREKTTIYEFDKKIFEIVKNYNKLGIYDSIEIPIIYSWVFILSENSRSKETVLEDSYLHLLCNNLHENFNNSVFICCVKIYTKILIIVYIEFFSF